MTRTSAETTAGYDPRTGAFHVQHDWDADDSLTELVVCSVAAVAGLEPMEVDPLSTRIDTDALEAMFDVDGQATGESAVTFRLNDCRITVYDDGEVVIRPPDRFY